MTTGSDGAGAVSPHKGTLLIVDDNPNNLRVLSGMLEQAGYKVRPALNGELAIRSIHSSPPDLVLLDIRMPGMDGYEVCHRLKEDERTRNIPVVFISALQETNDKINAFKAGGVDYVVKPFQLDEVLARVNTHVSLRHAQSQLERAYAEVEARVQARTRELQDSHQRIQRQSQVEKTLGEILRLSLAPMDLDGYLMGVLDALAELAPWTNPWQKNAIFLTEQQGEGRSIRLAAAKNFGREHESACASVPFGRCLCGRAAESKSTVYSSDVDGRHELVFEDMRPHGHYSVPILEGEKVLGVLVHYLESGHPRAEDEVAFLQRVTATLGTGIARRYAEDKIEYLAYHDSLTDLPNRRLLTDRINQELYLVRRRATHGALLFLDLDFFKKVNDGLGHDAGDELLREAARRIAADLRGEDTVARWGGDEFVIMLPAMGDDADVTAQNAHAVAEKLRRSLAQPFHIGSHELQLTASIGIALFPADGELGEELLTHADSAMYQAKQKGRNAIRFYQPEFQTAAEARLSLEKDLRHALGSEGLALYMQPQFEADARIIGAEALLRWNHPQRGLVSPADFIPVAEETGMILPLGRWVVDEACRLIRGWEDEGLLDSGFRRLSVNVSAKQFYEPDFPDQVEAALKQSGVDPGRLELEVTESILVVDIQGTIATMKRLRALGLTFAIDDFGTGYSSLSYLRRLPVDKLKIDRSFVNEVHKDSQDAAIVETIISMAEHLGLLAIAEGVETEEELGFLRAKGCAAFQGFYFARPLPADEFAERLRASQRRQGGENRPGNPD